MRKIRAVLNVTTTGALIGIAISVAVSVISHSAIYGALTGGNVWSMLPSIARWVGINLGTSVYLFSILVILYGITLSHLRHRLISMVARTDEILHLENLLDMWCSQFTAVGVIWTVVGMHSAAVSLGTTQDISLQALFESGMLSALTTTIVGGIGGRLLNLCKAFSVGALLKAHFHSENLASEQTIFSKLDIIASMLQAQSSPNEGDAA